MDSDGPIRTTGEEFEVRRSPPCFPAQRSCLARPAYEQIGSVLGQANCIRNLGDVAFDRFDYDTAKGRYQDAQPLCEQIGDLRGQANCITGLGDIASDAPTTTPPKPATRKR